MPCPLPGGALLLCFLLLLLPALLPVADAEPSGADTSGRAVVVVEGGGGPHPYTTPSAACTKPRAYFIQRLLDAGLPAFTAPGYLNTVNSTAFATGCPPQPPVEVQWNTLGYPTSAGYAMLCFLGYLHETYNYTTFDLVGYSYGGVVSRAAIAALKWPPPANTRAPGFSYAWTAIDAGVTISSLTTMNTPHLGSPAYDIADNPKDFLKPVAKAWGAQFAQAQSDLIQLTAQDAGAIEILVTRAHKASSNTWDMQQVGALDGVALTLMAGDYCGWSSKQGRARARAKKALRQDGTVPVYSQLMEPCPAPSCPKVPGSAYVPPGLVPAGAVRQTFPTLHSTFAAKALNLPSELSVSQNPPAVDFLVATVLGHWAAAGAQLLP